MFSTRRVLNALLIHTVGHKTVSLHFGL